MATRHSARQTAGRRRAAAGTRATHSFGRFGYRRSLRFEPLEDRRLLAVVTVDTDQDVVDSNDDVLSLREAILATNAVPGPDTIEFASSLTAGGPATILLTEGELRITDDLTIDGPGAELLKIDAQQQSRIMRIDNPATSVDDFEVTLAGLTLTGGHTSIGGNRGGAIRADNLYLFINDSVIEGNDTSSDTSWGGAIFSEGYVTVTNSILRDNFTSGSNSVGGAIFARGDVTLNDSIVANNHTTGFSANAGGIRSNGEVILLRSTVSGNWTEGDDASGGGIEAVGDIILTNSTVSGNSTFGDGAFGGGMFTFDGVDLSQSTISGNSTAGSNADGGGIRVSRQVSITQSTITANSAERSGVGAGLFQTNYLNDFPVTITDTIIAGNLADGRDADLLTDPQSTKTVNYTLIGDTFGSGVTASTGIGNLLNVDPALGPLADNGGPTMTHALLSDSPAIDAGDPDAMPGEEDVPVHDQRGAPFTRVYGGRIDIGALEWQPPGVLLGDYNQDGTVDAADYVVWRDELSGIGGGGDSELSTDGNGDGVVDEWDYQLWRGNFGSVLADVAVSGGGAIAPPSATVIERMAPLAEAQPRPAEPSAITVRQSAPAVSRRVNTAVAVRQDQLLSAWVASRLRGDNRWDQDDALTRGRRQGGEDNGTNAHASVVDRVFRGIGVREDVPLAGLRRGRR